MSGSMYENEEIMGSKLSSGRRQKEEHRRNNNDDDIDSINFNDGQASMA